MNSVDLAFESLFFGSGSYLGLLLLITIMVSLLHKWRSSGVLILPTIFLLETEYYSRITTSPALVWNMLTMLVMAIFTMAYMIGDMRRKT